VAVSFVAIAEKMKAAAGAEPRFNDFMLKVSIEDYELTLFPDGRAIVKGTSSPDEARTVYARYVGA
jgi:adenylyltransferase/sulfurtransferase